MTPQFLSAKSYFDNQQQPVSIFQNIWLENSTALFHGPRHLANKSELALSIANDVALSGRDVLYISTEPSFGSSRADADKLFIFTPEFESIDDNRDYADLVFDAIEHAVRNTAIRTFIVDSVTRIAALSFGRNASAAYLMKRLVALQVKCKLSLLVVADDTTKSTDRALLSLAATELNLSEKPEQKENHENCVRSDHSEISENSKCSNSYLTPYPPALTRQQRRALARQAAKR